MLLRFFLLVIASMGWLFASAQQRVTIFQEGFGEGALNVAVPDFTGWDNPECQYTGTGKIGFSNLHVCTLPGSSGKGYLYFSSENIRYMMIRQVDIAGYRDLEFSCNLKKNKVYSGELLVEIYVDNKKVLSYNPQLKNTDDWFTVPAHSIPSGSVLDVKLYNEDTGVVLYMDDLVLTGVADVPLCPEMPVITPASGLYTEPVSLTLESPSGASVYYTLDGSVPTENSELYRAPVLLDHTATVSAVAVSDSGRSEVATAHYEIRRVSAVEGVQAFKEAEDVVRLDLQQAEVTDVDINGIYVQMADGGLLLPAGSVPALKGDRLNGFLLGKPQAVYGMTGVADGVFSQITVSSGTAGLVPLVVSLSEVLSCPERYTACFLQLDGMRYGADDQTVYETDTPEQAALRVVTGDWALEETWNWPEEMTLQGVLKADESGLYLWIASAAQVIATGSQLTAEPLGTALVITERDGTYHAVQTNLNGEWLAGTPVAVLHGQAVAPVDKAADLLWNIREDKGYLMTPDGHYLQGISSEAGLKWTLSPDASCQWYKPAEKGFWMWQKGERALFRNNMTGQIKNFALSLLESSIYSSVPAVDMPLFAGYLRELTPGRWGTVCVPYAVNKEDCAGALFFEIMGRLNDEEGNARSVVLSEPTDHLEAGVPYVIYAETSTLALLYAGDPVSVPLSRNGLQGTFEGINTEKNADDAALEGMYVFSDNMLRKCMAGSSVGENKAYVDLNKVPLLPEMPAGALRIQVNDELAGLNPASADQTGKLKVYTLDGIYKGTWSACKEKLPKGVYIVGNTKISIK